MNIPLGRTLGGRLLAVILIFSLAPAAAVAGVFYLEFSRSLHEDGMAKLLMAAEKYAEGLNLWLDSHQRKIEALAELPAVKSFDPDQFLPIIKQFASKDWDSEFYFVAKLDGTRWLSDGSTDNISDREYFQRFLKEKRTLWSKPDFSKATGKPRVVIVAPVLGKDWSLLGVVGMALSLNRLNQYVSALKIGGTGYPYVVDAEGLCLAHPVKENVLKLNITRSGSESLDRAAQNMLAKRRTVERYVWQGVDKYVASAPVTAIGWLVVATQPVEEFVARIRLASSVALAILAAVAVVAVLLGLLLARQIARPVAGLARQAEVLATGNLTASPEVRGFGEVRVLAESLGRVTQGLRGIVVSVKEAVAAVEKVIKEVLEAAATTSQAAQQVADSVSQISAGAEEMSANAGAISQITTETAANMERLTARVEEIARLTQEATAKTREGAEAMERLARALEEVARQGELTRQVMEELTRKTGEVREIAGVITGIAEQTNLLALNAAIEAARAGEHGRGFAVVAEEVRKLAEEASRRAEEISGLTEEVGGDIERAASAVISTAQLLTEQRRLGEEARVRFAEIAASAGSVADFLEEIRGQARAIMEKGAEIARQVSGIAAVTEQSAASAQEIAAGAEEMSAAAGSLEGSARRLSELFDRLKTASDRFTV